MAIFSGLMGPRRRVGRQFVLLVTLESWVDGRRVFWGRMEKALTVLLDE